MALIDITDFKGDQRTGKSRLRDPYWHFIDTRYERPNDFLLITTFPHVMYVHIDQIDGGRWDEPTEEDAAHLRIRIRRWVERNISGDVVYARQGMTYTRVYAKNPNRPDDRERPHSEYRHGYYVFHFEHETDAFAFRFQFSEVVTKILPYRPDHPPEPGSEDFTDRWKADRLIKGY